MSQLDVQYASSAPDLPTEQQLQAWVDAVLDAAEVGSDVVIRIVDYQESAELNQRYRDKSGATNVLSFQFEAPENSPVVVDHLGDLVICAPVVTEEANVQQKSVEAHWLHMVVHGLLHLLNYNHLIPGDASLMEAEEVRILHSLGVANPYEIS